MSKNRIKVVDMSPNGYEKITVLTSAVSQLDATKRRAAKAVFITIETANIRYRIDGGGDPTSSEGHLVAYGNNLMFANVDALENLRIIAISSTATLIVTYYE